MFSLTVFFCFVHFFHFAVSYCRVKLLCFEKLIETISNFLKIFRAMLHNIFIWFSVNHLLIDETIPSARNNAFIFFSSHKIGLCFLYFYLSYFMEAFYFLFLKMLTSKKELHLNREIEKYKISLMYVQGFRVPEIT